MRVGCEVLSKGLVQKAQITTLVSEEASAGRRHCDNRPPIRWNDSRKDSIPSGLIRYPITSRVKQELAAFE
ncbi:hypothetical protein EDD95_3061 [Streptomyces sp. CEV 2-1]|nr:hypothetical protein EDD95_3061 [Streptomyces sp. CEV 2-1]